MIFERRGDKLISRKHFYHRLARSLCWALMIVAGSLIVGVSGYHFIENLPWIDALLDASMILSGMGPVNPIKSNGGKLFASFYAIYSGLVIIGLMALLLAPVFHRLLHAFHQEPKTRS